MMGGGKGNGRTRDRVWVACSTTTIALLSLVGRAHADDEKAQCVAASERGQQLRDDNSYSEARAAFARCARDACPGPVRRDCLQWLVDLNTAYPSIVIRARDDAGADLVNVNVTLDGRPLVSRLDGSPLPLDPGVHAAHFEAPGFSPVDERLVVRTGEKNRPLDVTFRRPPATPVDAERASPEKPETHDHEGGPWRTVGPIVLATGVVALGVGTAFGLSAKSKNDESNLSGCRGDDCTPAAATVRRDALSTARAATAAFAVGSILAAGGAALWIFAPSGRDGARVGVVPLVGPSGGGLWVSGGWH